MATLCSCKMRKSCWVKQDIWTISEVDSCLDVHNISFLCIWGLGWQWNPLHLIWAWECCQNQMFQKCFRISFTSSSFGAHCQNQVSASYQRHGLLFHHFILTRNLCFLFCTDAESLWDLLARQKESFLARPTFRNWPTGIYCTPVSTCMTKLNSLLQMDERQAHKNLGS